MQSENKKKKRKEQLAFSTLVFFTFTVCHPFTFSKCDTSVCFVFKTEPLFLRSEVVTATHGQVERKAPPGKEPSLLFFLVFFFFLSLYVFSWYLFFSLSFFFRGNATSVLVFFFSVQSSARFTSVSSMTAATCAVFWRLARRQLRDYNWPDFFFFSLAIGASETLSQEKEGKRCELVAFSLPPSLCSVLHLIGNCCPLLLVCIGAITNGDASVRREARIDERIGPELQMKPWMTGHCENTCYVRRCESEVSSAACFTGFLFLYAIVVCVFMVPMLYVL